MHPKALVIEDNRAVAKLIELQLTDLYRIEHAANLQEALELLRKTDIDLILTDINLPDSDQKSTMKVLRRAVEKTPIVILSNYITDDILTEASELGCVALSKELISTRRLSDTLGNALMEDRKSLPITLHSAKKTSEKLLQQREELQLARQVLLGVTGLILVLGVLQIFTGYKGQEALFAALASALGYITVAVVTRKNDKTPKN